MLAAYGLAPDTPEPEVVAHLFKLYADTRKKEKKEEGEEVEWSQTSASPAVASSEYLALSRYS